MYVCTSSIYTCEDLPYDIGNSNLIITSAVQIEVWPTCKGMFT